MLKCLWKTKLRQNVNLHKVLIKHVIIERKVADFFFFDFFPLTMPFYTLEIHNEQLTWTHIKFMKQCKALFVQSKSIRKCQPFLTQITPAAVCLQGMWTVFKSYEYLTFLIHAFRISFCGTYIPNNTIMDILPKHNKKSLYFFYLQL